MAIDLTALRTAVSDFVEAHHRELASVTADRDAAFSDLAAAEQTIADLVAQLRGTVPGAGQAAEQPTQPAPEQ